MKKNNKQLKILVTAVGSPSSSFLINEFKKNNVYIIGTDSDSYSHGFFMCDKKYVIPKGKHPNYIESILRICSYEGINAILAGPEEELIVISKNRDYLADLDVKLLIPDHETILTCTDKSKCYSQLKKLNISIPDIYDENHLKFPCILKPKSGRGATNVYKVYNKKELTFFIQNVKDPIIQEFVTGTEYTVDILTNWEGIAISIIPRIRLNIESGISMKGITKRDEKIISYSRKIVEELKIIGPSCIQCIKTSKNEIKFTDINLRFGGGSALSFKANINLMRNYLQLLNNENVKPNFQFIENLVMLRNYNEIFVRNEEIQSLDDNNEFGF